jgi:hypothetical protein
MIAHNVQTSDTVANALVLIYFKTTLFTLFKNFPLFYPVHLFDPYITITIHMFLYNVYYPVCKIIL